MNDYDASNDIRYFMQQFKDIEKRTEQLAKMVNGSVIHSRFKQDIIDTIDEIQEMAKQGKIRVFVMVDMAEKDRPAPPKLTTESEVKQIYQEYLKEIAGIDKKAKLRGNAWEEHVRDYVSKCRYIVESTVGTWLDRKWVITMPNLQIIHFSQHPDSSSDFVDNLIKELDMVPCTMDSSGKLYEKWPRYDPSGALLMNLMHTHRKYLTNE